MVNKEKYVNFLKEIISCISHGDYYSAKELSQLELEKMEKAKKDNNIYGKIIKKYRKKRSFSISDLTKKLNLMNISISDEELYKIEKQEEILKDFELVAICGILDINVEDLKIKVK